MLTRGRRENREFLPPMALLGAADEWVVPYRLR